MTTIFVPYDGLGDGLATTAVARKYFETFHQPMHIAHGIPELFENNPYCINHPEYALGRLTMPLLRELHASGGQIKYLNYQKFRYYSALGRFVYEFDASHMTASMAADAGLSGTINSTPQTFLTPEEQKFGRFSSKPQIALISKGSKPFKSFPAEELQHVVDLLKARYDFIQVGLLSDPPLQGVTRDFRGKLSLRQLAAVLFHSDLFLGSTGGLMHLCRSVGTPAVILYAESEPRSLAQYSCFHNVFTQEPCDLCKKHNHVATHFETCIKNYSCTEHYPLPEILAGIDTLLDEENRKPLAEDEYPVLQKDITDYFPLQNHPDISLSPILEMGLNIVHAVPFDSVAFLDNQSALKNCFVTCFDKMVTPANDNADLLIIDNVELCKDSAEFCSLLLEKFKKILICGSDLNAFLASSKTSLLISKLLKSHQLMPTDTNANFILWTHNEPTAQTKCSDFSDLVLSYSEKLNKNFHPCFLYWRDTQTNYRETSKFEFHLAPDTKNHYLLNFHATGSSSTILKFSLPHENIAIVEEFKIVSPAGELLLTIPCFRLEREHEVQIPASAEKHFHISFSIKLLDRLCAEIIDHFSNTGKCLNEKIKQLEEELATTTKQLHNVQAAFDSVVTSQTYKMTRPVRAILDKVKENRFGALFIKALKFYIRNGFSATMQKIRYGMPVSCNNCLLISQASLKKTLKSSRMTAPSKFSVKVAIIIPVYNGLEHLRKLTGTLFKNTNENQCRFVFINDASPDSSITPFLQELQRRDSRVVLMDNPQNLGFVKTVNKAVNANRDVDVFVLLNTDTEVPPGWLSRLIQPMLQDPKVATVTPFSNGATIFSVPIPDENNRDLINVFTTEEIDQAFQKYSLPELNTQTVCGVGFCMALNPKVWREIGPLDEKTFEKGFGEEADWCMRAFRAGYKNVISPNLFVSHFHGGSFSSDEKKQLLKCHQTILDQRYPEFQKLLQKHNSINAPLWTTIGIAAILETVLSETAAPLAILDHSWGGGANSFRNKMIQDTLAEGRSVLLLIPAGQSIHAIAYRNNFKVECRLANLSLLKHPLFRNIHEIVLNELVSWPDLYGGNKLSAKQYMKFVQNFIEIKNHLRATVRYMFHDFFLLCPHLNLFSNQGHYCKPSQSAAECISCIKTRMPYERYYRVESSLTGTAWRAASQELISNINEIRFFSQNSLEIVKNLLDMKDSQVSLIPHAPQHQFVPIKLTTSPLTIGFVGAISKVKGADFVVEFANYLKQHAPEVVIVIIGIIDTDVANIPDNIHVHGAYQPEELPSLIDRYGINIGFISSLCPETFSYVTQELMMLGIPLVCFDIGAPADRIRNWNKGMIIPEISAAAAWATIQKLYNDWNSSK